jgi:hypothetical protein
MAAAHKAEPNLPSSLHTAMQLPVKPSCEDFAFPIRRTELN